jgi:glucose/arabinose dehydrogenase
MKMLAIVALIAATWGPDVGSLVAPPGFTVTTYASVPGARFMTLSPDGVVYVSQSHIGKIVKLIDNGHGTADSVVVVAEGLNLPHGMAFHHGFFYVANTDGVVRLTLGPDGKATGDPVYVNHYSHGSGHSTRTIVFGPDSAMYVSIGSSCNLCVEQDSDRAVVMRYDEDGSHGRVFARGLRNAVGLAVSPSGAIWATVNERDNIEPDHENLPPDELEILQDGGNYGWPYCYGHTPNPEFASESARCASVTVPALGFQAHSAPLGIAFLAGASQFPRDYQGDVLVAFHGSWNRAIPTGDKVVRVHVVNGRPVSYDDFITGWQRYDGSRWGRPVGIVVARDGSVLISDDASGTIYRVTRHG